MKNLKYIFLALISLAVAVSCSKFEELNTNPDAAATVPSDMIATQVLKDNYRFFNPNATDWSNSNLWLKLTTRLDGSTNIGGQYYNPYPYYGFGGFKRLTDLKKMVEYAKGLPTEPSYQGLALYLKAEMGFNMTIALGDIPYSETGMAADGITQPKYDKQADVIAAVLKDFEAAEVLFAKGAKFGGDIMYGGDVTKWRKLCNTMQLKVIQTISKKATVAQKARFAAIVAAGNLMTGYADDFTLKYFDNPNASNPMYQGETNRIYSCGSKLLVDNLKLLKDRRLFYFVEPALALIAPLGTKLPSDFDAYVGAPTELATEKLAIGRAANEYSLVNIRYTVSRIGDPWLKITYSEQCFIIAEAIEEGWLTGDAKAYYENGVKAQLAYYMSLPYHLSTGKQGEVQPPFTGQAGVAHGMPIDQAYIDGYFTGAAAYAATKADRLKQIWLQRWLIEYFQAGQNYYPTFLRTGYPVFPLDPATSMNPEDPTKYPQRSKYDTNESVTNPVNYKKAIDEQYGGFDGINKIPWYLQ
ncbi:MAG: SusD/RagB family nutrient-binding outer membrane lipoprotein [Bacteroidota bacterium]|nr:SusD/RagB family nutrient-binding outer membrane lipoprotein [Bacteroidota bacterium]